MPQNKYHDPQNDVVQIKDGRRVPVAAYDMYAAMHAGPEASARQQPPAAQPDKPAANDHLSLRFDGQYLTLIDKQADGTHEYSYAAVSGRPQGDNTFTYGKERQKLAKVGPIPEGQHLVDTKTMNYWKNASWVQKSLSMVGGGQFPGGPHAWGEGHMDVILDPAVAKATGRSGITIHGGSTPGSAGCIDLVTNDKAFFSRLEELKGTQEIIPLTVDYSHTPQEVHFPFWEKLKSR